MTDINVMVRSITYSKTIPGREEISLHLELDDKDNILNAKLTGVGSLFYLQKLSEVRRALVGMIHDIKTPDIDEEEPGSLLIRSAVLFVKGMWCPPYKEEVICHCRGVKTNDVDIAIITGARTVSEIMRTTSASTACGTCQPDVIDLIRYWTGK